ncbi:hypothetical protein AX27061_4116 [Achromobacter xylosoxidans NBRC 15126 = ATCC 27061]|nr:hypothetical protein AX27061_4116 [Achromobacter xylosoxidans NBRC 15126 = ATCC 27061]
MITAGHDGFSFLESDLASAAPGPVRREKTAARTGRFCAWVPRPSEASSTALFHKKFIFQVLDAAAAACGRLSSAARCRRAAT